MQRLILLAIASVMSLGFLGACGGEDPVEEPATTEETAPMEEEAPMEEGTPMEEETPEGEAPE